MTIRRLQPEGRLAGAVVHGDTVYLAGQVADDPSLDAEGQTADILRQIDALLAEAKEHSRKALPGMSQHQMHLKKSANLYEKGRSELQKALQDKNLDASKRNEIESVLPKINKQIYWANKMGTL